VRLVVITGGRLHPEKTEVAYASPARPFRRLLSTPESKG
jgi:hypothetical protein